MKSYDGPRDYLFPALTVLAILTVLVLATLCLGPSAHAATLFEWDRNSESDVDHYEMYACSTSSICVPGTDAASRIGADVPQSVIGTKPSMLIPIGKEGRAAVLAVDLVGNKSGLSNIVPFDSKAPANPSGLVTK